MFRNKVLFRAAASSSSSSAPLPPFLLRQLSLPAAVPIPTLDLDILCCRLSRRHRLACLPQPPADSLLVYQRCQSREAAEAVSEIMAAFPGAWVGEEEELACSGALVAKAVECGLRSLMLEHGWRCLGESIYIESAFLENEERSDLCAVNVEVRLGRNDDFKFLVSPDAFRFTTHKISGAASSHMMETFQLKEVVLDSCNFLTVCTTLPTLQEGHVIGYSKILPSEQCLDKFMELCSLKHGLDTNYNYHVAVKLTHGASLETQWLPSSFVLQGSGLQPALKSVRASKAMSSLQSFIDVLKAWNFFGQNQLVIKEQLLLNCTATLPTWDKAASNLTLHTARTDNSKDQPFILDFRTPKPAVFCSLTAKSWDTKVHKVAHSLDDNYNLSCTSSIKYGCQSKPHVLTSSCKAQVTLLKPSFSRTKPAEKRKMRYSSEHPDADNSNKSSHPDAAASHANPVTSSSAILHMPVIQVSENHERKHAELLKNSCGGGGGIAKVQQGYLEKRNLDTRKKSKEYTPGMPEVAKAIQDIDKVVLTTKVLNPTLKSVVAKDEVTAEAKTTAKKDLDKKELIAVTKQKTVSEAVKDEFARKVRGYQNDELNKKVTKARAKPVDKDILNSAARTKAKPDVNDELIAKVIDHHRRGELRLLTVADLKCFLGAKKAKVGGTKEVLIQRATELLA
ncbi:uncharacterized protein LOC133903056 isoform X2 [Phragmites australis]|uniref:uncharacterized protein LOC133903056 isoform X2 n=1 Tax=Phragmites australis TaxID=29695 RepID=UPI002D777C0A|nr:uncharacterized protein LOC133903056 isoform X2 [Phragmites australis]